MSEHEVVEPGTKLPWAVHPIEAWVVRADDLDAPVCALRMATCGLSREGDARQDATYIVRACNSYPSLVGALQRIAEETKRQQLPITALVHGLATDTLNLALGGKGE